MKSVSVVSGGQKFHRSVKTKRTIATIAGIAALALPICATVSAQSSDALLNKLVEKGILSVKEANDLRDESNKGFEKTLARKSKASGWVEAMKFYGDFRGRYDGTYQSSQNAVPDRHQFRYRLRFGTTVEMTDHFEVGLRLDPLWR